MKRILVVEDEQMLAKIIGMKLEEESFEVIHAYDGEEAYNELSKPELPDLVLLDVLLPKMSGFDVLEKLRSEGKPMAKVIVFSNFAQKADVERAHALGAIDYIVKAAFSPAEILSKIKSVFAQSDAALAAPVPGVLQAQSGAYTGFSSMEDVMPMSEVLRPGEPNNNP
jgi:DNA-binding response OmpR family regulator